MITINERKRERERKGEKKGGGREKKWAKEKKKREISTLYSEIFYLENAGFELTSNLHAIVTILNEGFK
jgi:hypothetical protein